MANTFKVLFRGAASTDSTTLYTTPADTTALVTAVVVANTTTDDLSFSLDLSGTPLTSGSPVSANDSIVIEVKQVVAAGETISGHGAEGVNFHISGLEIT